MKYRCTATDKNNELLHSVVIDSPWNDGNTKGVLHNFRMRLQELVMLSEAVEGEITITEV